MNLSLSQEARDIAERLNIRGCVLHSAEDICFRYASRAKFRPSFCSHICAAAIFIACRRAQCPRTLKEVVLAVNDGSLSLTRRFHGKILRTLQECNYVAKPEEFINRFCRLLDLPVNVMSLATHFAKRSEELKIVSNRNPVAVSSACIYMAAAALQIPRTSELMFEKTGVPISTLRCVYGILLKNASKMYPTDQTLPVAPYGLPTP
ncbi:hypothetical protein ACOME3_008913 [Neoechinorhynchus agilis]